ncbi:hypothetical protein PtrM4_152930 [Pyrenophora tritici-repentis]|uniref:Uncharacterized protein n=1 Tax=Pyrenophora tritici-repentis TaxID=45151 RepID=A0A834RHI4_9PLEO|nr:hypothetical protein PtrM4_152930 [Pyrenophora tritici-repentis]
MGENGATLAALEQPAVALPLSEHNSKALSPERVGFIQHTLHSVPEWLSKANPRQSYNDLPPTTKSSAKDSILRTVQLQYAGEQPNFNGTANAGLVRFWAKGLFVSDWCRRKSPVLAWILT